MLFGRDTWCFTGPDYVEGRKERRKEGRKEGRKGRKASTEYEKSGNFKAPKNGGDFNTKKCSFYKGRGQNPDPGPSLGLHRL